MQSAPSTRPWRHYAVRLFLVFFFACGLAPLSVLAQNDLSASSVTFVAGQVIVTFTKEAARSIEMARAARQLPRVGDPAIDELFTRFKVAAVTPVFSSAQSPEAIRAKYPARAKRAPAGAVTPDLSRTYTLSLDPAADVLEAVAVFSLGPFVEHAEPNHLVTLDAPEETPR